MAKKGSMFWLGLVLAVVLMCAVPFGRASAADRKEIRVGAVNSMTGPECHDGCGTEMGLRAGGVGHQQERRRLR